MTDQTLKDIDRAFKALEERDELLDKIIAKLTEEKESYEKVGNWKKAYGFEKSIEIIDRYKGGQK